MKKFSTITILLGTMILFQGCAETKKALPAQNFNMTDYGPAPSVKKYKGEIKGEIQAVLKDPYSAKFKFGKPRRAYYRLKYIEKAIPGWIIPCTVNAKNSFGGYSGDKFWNGFIINSRKKDYSSVLMFVDTLENSIKERGLTLFPNP